MSRIHEVLKKDGVIIGELMDGGKVGEAGLCVVLEPGELPGVWRVLVRHPYPYDALRVFDVVFLCAGGSRYCCSFF